MMQGGRDTTPSSRGLERNPSKPCVCSWLRSPNQQGAHIAQTTGQLVIREQIARGPRARNTLLKGLCTEPFPAAQQNDQEPGDSGIMTLGFNSHI